MTIIKLHIAGDRPKKYHWKKYDVDIVFEVLVNLIQRKLTPHLKRAKKVIVSAPCKNADKTIVFGVNELD